jgi:hypothetical protein
MDCQGRKTKIAIVEITFDVHVRALSLKMMLEPKGTVSKSKVPLECFDEEIQWKF